MVHNFIYNFSVFCEELKFETLNILKVNATKVIYLIKKIITELKVHLYLYLIRRVLLIWCLFWKNWCNMILVCCVMIICMSMKTEAVFTKIEMNNEGTVNFLQNIPFVFSTDLFRFNYWLKHFWNSSSFPLLIVCKAAASDFF